MRFSESEIQQIITQKILELTYKKVSSVDEELIENRVLNSITIVELAVELEKEFSINISFMEINNENFKTVSSIKNLTLKK